MLSVPANETTKISEEEHNKCHLNNFSRLFLFGQILRIIIVYIHVVSRHCRSHTHTFLTEKSLRCNYKHEMHICTNTALDALLRQSDNTALHPKPIISQFVIMNEQEYAHPTLPHSSRVYSGLTKENANARNMPKHGMNEIRTVHKNTNGQARRFQLG